MIDRSIPQNSWNKYLKKYVQDYRLKRDGIGIWQILAKHGTIQTYSIVNEKLCAVLEFSTARQLSGFLGKIRGLDYTITQLGYSDVVVVFSEKAAWELEVDSIEDRNANLILNKRFLSCINDKMETIEFSIFENFILVKDTDSNLLLAFEQDFDNED